MARPSPVPPKRRVVDASAWANASKMSRLLSAAMPMPVSWTATRNVTRVGGHRLGVDAHRDFAALGELDRVADQVDEDLAEPAGVADEIVGNARTDLVRQLERLGVSERRRAS